MSGSKLKNIESMKTQKCFKGLREMESKFFKGIKEKFQLTFNYSTAPIHTLPLGWCIQSKMSLKMFNVSLNVSVSTTFQRTDCKMVSYQNFDT